MSVLLALGAAALFALGAVLQQRAVIDEVADGADSRLTWRLIRRPFWIAGLLADMIGAVGQAVALGIGKLLVVQPLLASYVVFALPLGVVLTGQKVGRRAVLAATAVAAGLSGFLLLSEPGGGARDAPLLDWLAASAVIVVVVSGLMWFAQKLDPAPKAALRGAAAGCAFALGAALIKEVVTVLQSEGVTAMLADWHFYAAAFVASATIALNQLALKAGVLAPAVTASVMLNSVASVALGVLIFNEQLQASSGSVIGSFASLLLMVGGVLALSIEEHGSPEDEPEVADSA